MSVRIRFEELCQEVCGENAPVRNKDQILICFTESEEDAQTLCKRVKSDPSFVTALCIPALGGEEVWAWPKQDRSAS